VKTSLRNAVVVATCLVTVLGLAAVQGTLGAAANVGTAPGSAIPPITSANGATQASSAASAGAPWHAAQASSGPGHSDGHAVHFSLPRTSKLVVPSGASARGATHHAAPGAGTSNIKAGVAPAPSLNVQPPAASQGGGTRDITIGTNFNGSGYTGWIPPDGGMAAYSSVAHGAAIKFTETPKSGHHFVKWLVNGVAKGNATTLSVVVNANTTVAAVYT
jgi:Divergent InlB B-repeat domain